jgi:hypothetical protein
MDDKITIIEGPPPTFEVVMDGWAMGLNESPFLYDMMMTRLRTFNGQALVERCHRAWRNRTPIYLHFRNDDGLEEKVPIFAARSIDGEEGQVLQLWIRKEPDHSDFDMEIDVDDDEDEDYDIDDDDGDYVD